MSGRRVGSPTRAEGWAIAAAFATASVLGLAQLSIVARWLTKASNAEFVALWGLIFAFGSVLGSMEQYVAKQSAVSTLAGSRVSMAPVQSVGVATAGATVALGVLLLTPSGQNLVGGSAVTATTVFVALLGFAGLTMSRGILLGSHRIASYVVVLVGEGVLRVLFIVLVVGSAIAPSVQWAVAGIVVGCFSWIVVVRVVARSIGWSGRLTPWRPVVSVVAALAIANGLTAVVLTGFPTVATMAIGDAGGLADLFAVMTFSRVPLVLLTPVQALTVPVVVRWIRTGQDEKLHRAVARLSAGSVLLSAVGGLGGYWLGPWAVQVLLGEQYTPDRITSAIVLAATCALGIALVQAAVIVALGRYWVLTMCWAATVVASLAAMVLLPWSAEARATAGFVVAACVAATAIGVTLDRCRAGVTSDAADRG